MENDMLGKKVKELRLAKGMTQAALSGDTITRNMLSQIENGVANPSVSTIMELAGKLDTPIEYFFSENGRLEDFKKLGAIGKIKKLFAAGRYSKCISALDALGVSDDETELIYTKSLWHCGEDAFARKDFGSASLFFELAKTHGKRSVYLDADFFALLDARLAAIAEEEEKEDDL